MYNKSIKLLLIILLNSFILDEDSAQVPFPELSGESVEYLERTSDAILALSNFRLFIRFKDSFVNVSCFGCLECVCLLGSKTIWMHALNIKPR